MRRVVILLVFVIVASFALAQNDPGHDTLYIEEEGDSELNGTFNVTENVTVKGGEIEIDNQFLIRGDANIPGTNINYVVGDFDNFISINSLGNGKVVRLQDQVANGLVQIGTTSTNLVDLNVSNDLYTLGNLFTLDNNFELRTDGTFPSSISSIVVNETGANAKMWLTSEDIRLGQGTTTGEVHIGYGGSDAVTLNVTGDLTVQGTTGTIGGSNICTDTNGLCGDSGSNVSGTGTTGQITYWSGASNVSSDANLTWDSTTNRLGVNQPNPLTPTHFLTTGSAAALTLESRSGANAFSVLDIYSNKSGGVGGSRKPGILFSATNDDDNKYTYASIYATMTGGTGGSENGAFEFWTSNSGTNGVKWYMQNTGRLSYRDNTPDAIIELIRDDTNNPNIPFMYVTNSTDGDLFSIRNTGRVGLGDFTPEARLEIVKWGDDTSADYFIITDSSDGDIFTIDNNGNVGIGVANPGESLDVDGSINVTTGNDICIEGGNCLSNSVTSEADTLALVTGRGATTTTASSFTSTANPGLTVGNGATGYLRIGGSTISDATGDLTLDSDSGEVYIPDELGIGTVSPAERLHVLGTDDIYVRVEAGGGSSTAGFEVNANNKYWQFLIDGGTTLEIKDLLAGESSITVQAATPTNTLYLSNSSGGMVGIGTNVPGERLHVNGSINVTAGEDICIEGGNCLSAAGAGSSPWTASGGNIYNTTANVGIGTDAPTQKLHVNGSINVTEGNVSVQEDYYLCFNSDCTSRIYDNGTALVIEGQ